MAAWPAREQAPCGRGGAAEGQGDRGVGSVQDLFLGGTVNCVTAAKTAGAAVAETSPGFAAGTAMGHRRERATGAWAELSPDAGPAWEAGEPWGTTEETVLLSLLGDVAVRGRPPTRQAWEGNGGRVRCRGFNRMDLGRKGRTRWRQEA